MGSSDGSFPPVSAGLVHSGGIPYPVPGPPVPQLSAPLAHLPDLAANSRRNSEFADVRIPGHVLPYHIGDPYRPSSAPGMGYTIDQDVQFGMLNKRRKLDREISSHVDMSVKPEINRMPSVGGTVFPTPPEGMRPLLADKSGLQPTLPKMTAKNQEPESAALAETTARLARLERLLTLQDHTYAERRLRLAEEAALRMLEGGGENSIFGSATTPAAGQASHAGNNGRPEIGYPAVDSHVHGGQELRIAISATGPHIPHARSHATGSVDHEDEGGDNHPDSAEVKGRYGQWDTVEIIGDAGYTGAEGLNALTAASVLVSDFAYELRNSRLTHFHREANKPTRPGYGKTFFARKSQENTNAASMEKLIGLSQVQATEIRSLIAVLPTIEVAQHLIERYFKLWGKSVHLIVLCPLLII